jgi:hypothetical protein
MSLVKPDALADVHDLKWDAILIDAVKPDALADVHGFKGNALLGII